jgi:hypothetical protein
MGRFCDDIMMMLGTGGVYGVDQANVNGWISDGYVQ